MKNSEKLRIAIIGTVGLPAKYGDFETLAEHLVNMKEDDFDWNLIGKKTKKLYLKN